jgi:hypothetical protein
MANRQNTFLLKRSNVPGKVPTPGDLKLGELAINTADVILYASGTTSNSILPIGWDRVSRTGDTVTGNFVINGGLTANTISATTYLNLPVLSGEYLPLSGGTVSGGTIFQSGLTANTIYTDYIDFNTTPTVPSPTGGTLYFDSNENALSYKPITNQNDVTVNLGQESLIRIYNDLPTTILNGQVLHITGATIGVPTVALANASKLGVVFTDSLAQSSGVATHDIPSGEYGFMTNFGIVRDLNTTAFTVGQEVFLSDTIDGGLTNDPNNIAFTSRISTVGYCLESNATTGKILVVITNENPLQSLTQQEVNVLLGNTISTGAYFYTGATTASTTTINVSPMRGWIVYNTGPTYATNPLVLNIYYSGGTNLPVSGLTSSFDTYLLVNSGGTLYQTNTYPTPQERRQNIFLGRVVHPNKTTILNVEQSVDYDVSPLSSLRDLWVPIKIINEGVVPSPNGATLTFKTSSGTFWGNGIGFPTDELNPNAITVPGYLPASFYYTTQTGGTFTVTTTTVDTTKYDVNGVAVNVPGSGNYTTQRIYMSQSGVIRLQYGQSFYSTLAKAIAAIPSETFVVNPDNSIDCILIGLLTVKDGTGDLSNTDDAVFTFVSKFGEILGGTAGISTTTLQQAYNNSVNPEIVTNSTLNGVQFKGGTGNDNDKNIIIETNSGTETAWITASGDSRFHSVSSNTISDVTRLSFNNSHTGTTAVGQLTFNTSEGTLNLGMLGGNVTQQIGLESYYQVINTTTVTGLTNGSVIASAGVDISTGKIVGSYMIADGSLPYYVTLGIATENIASGGTGYVNQFGIVRDIDTTGAPYGETWLQGDILYVSPTIPGGLTNVEPNVPNLKIQIAIVLKLDAINGSIFVKESLGYNLSNLHDVENSGGEANGDLLFYSASTNSWVYGKELTGNYQINGSLTATTYYGNGSNLTGIPDYYVTGGTFSPNTLTLNRQNGSVTITGFTSEIYVTGFTYDNANTLTIEQTGNQPDLNVTINTVTGLTVNGSVSATTYYGDGSNLTGISLVDTYVTGFTYDNANTITLSQNAGQPDLNVTINNMTGLTINGVLSATTITSNSIDSISVTSDTYTITTQTQDDTLNNFIVVDANGDFYIRNYNSINNIPNVVTVSLTGGSADFTSVKDACDSITAATSANTYTVKVYGGVYYENPFTIPSWVAVVGDSSISTIIEAIDSSQTLIYLSDQSAIFDCQVQGCTDTGVSAIIYSSSTTPQSAAISYVENVRFGANYTHARVVGYGGANIIMQCSNVKYGGYPFTIGFEATRNVSGIGRMQLRNVTSTNGGITTTTGLIFAKAVQPNCGFIVNGCLLTKSVGLAAGIGFYVENGGFLRLTGVNFQRWETGIYVPQVGSAPSIDAIALNFENCTTDVNIIHSGTTGKIQGTDNFLKTKININAPIYEVNTDPREIIVAKKGGDFSSIKSAVDYLSASATTSENSRYIISVGPGLFVENEIDLTSTPYVSIVGSSIQSTQIVPSTNTQHIIKLGINNEVSFLSLSGAGLGYAGIYCYDIGDFGQAHKVSFYDCDTNIWIESDTQDTKFYGEYLDFNGEYTYGTKVIGNNGYLALANMENYFNFPLGTGITYCNYATGSGATLNIFVGDNASNGVSGSTAFYIQDAAELNASTITVDGFTYGIRNPNIGDPVRFDVDNASIVNGEWDLYVERVGTFGTFGGSSSHEKIFTNSTDIYWSFLDIDDGELDITRKASVTFEDGTHTDFTTLLFEGSTMGLMEGGEITTVSAFTISTATGFGYLAKTLTPNVISRIDWVNSQITLAANENKYIYINENAILSSSGSRPDSVNNIILGRVVTNSTTVAFIDLSPAHSDHTSNRFGNLFRNALGPIYSTGSIVTENATPFRLDVTSGEYYYSTSDYMPSGGTAVNFTQYYRNGLGGWVTSATTVVNNTSYDGNGSLSALTAGYYTKHTLFVVGEGIYEEYLLVLGQNEYSTLIQAEDALLPTPPNFFSDSVTQIASIYIRQGASGITEVEDIRPVIGFKAGGVNASSVHGNLLGLAADDHTQYLLVNGSRAMSGNLDMGNNDIVSAGTINGVTIETHATRHQFGGADPVGSTTPSANAIPYADVSGRLDSWVSTGSTTTLGKVKLSAAPTLASNPIAVGTNDVGYLNSYTGVTYSSNTLTLKSVNNTTDSVTVGLKTKAGSVAGASFAGNPKKYTVTFTTPYPNTSYSIQITGGINRTFTYESKTTTGFVINANANAAFIDNVDWITIGIGES